MKFFNDIKKSIYSPEYYREILSKPFSYSLKYYVLFALAMSLIMAVVLSFTFLPKIEPFFDSMETKITRNYPQGLKVDIKNGQASANVQQPYFVKMPQSFKKNEFSPVIENIIVLDTENQFDFNKFDSYKTAVILNKDTVAYYKDNGVTIQSLKNMPDFSMDKEKAVSYAKKIKPFLIFIYPIFVFFAWVGTLFLFSWNLIYLFFAALLIWLVAKMKKMKIGYLKSYQLGIHLMTPVIILTFVLGLFKFNFLYVFTLLLILTAMININNNNDYEKSK